MKRLNIAYDVIAHKTVDSTFDVAGAVGISPRQLVKTVLLADDRGAILVSLAADQGLDFEALNRQLNRRLTLAYAKQFYGQLLGYEPIMLPPWHRLFNLPWVIEQSLCEQTALYVASGSANAVIRLSKTAFARMCSDAQIGHFGRQARSFVQEIKHVPQIQGAKSGSVTFAAGEMSGLRERFRRGMELPVIPGIAAQLVTLRGDANRDVVRAVKIIEQDPVLVANLLRYASSPVFAYQGKLQSVHEAIHHVLGLEQALDLALGLSLCNHFHGPREGRLGLANLWRDAFFSAITCQYLASCSSLPELRNRLSTAFLAGLLHNIGYLVLAQLFPTEYSLLNRLSSKQSEVSLVELERRTLAITHVEAGEALLAAWNLDDLLQHCAAAHHDLEYAGGDQAFARLMTVADLLLAKLGVGDMPVMDVPADCLQQAGLDHDALKMAQTHMLQIQSDIGPMLNKVIAA
ncbi:MAG: HDOD domain-containing protein [Gammaproteobacteria bacterium]|nr:HDOD domain-containing protein [Gammaproteobacteria bacterium]